MKNQYFGDINDYRKYGLLRVLSCNGEKSMLICWMLTPDDRGHDGGKIDYLNDPAKWRRYDPALFDFLKQQVVERHTRSVRIVENSKLMKGSSFFNDHFPDDSSLRSRLFSTLRLQMQGMDLVFFDPDNGLEIKSRRFGRKNSSKYIYWQELKEAYQESSLLVYQHLPRKPTGEFIRGVKEGIARRLSPGSTIAIKAGQVVYFLIMQPEAVDYFLGRLDVLTNRWPHQFQIL